MSIPVGVVKLAVFPAAERRRLNDYHRDRLGRYAEAHGRSVDGPPRLGCCSAEQHSITEKSLRRERSHTQRSPPGIPAGFSKYEFMRTRNEGDLFRGGAVSLMPQRPVC